MYNIRIEFLIRRFSKRTHICLIQYNQVVLSLKRSWTNPTVFTLRFALIIRKLTKIHLLIYLAKQLMTDRWLPNPIETVFNN